MFVVFNRRFLEVTLQTDLRHVFAEDCARALMTHGSAPAGCKHYSEGQGLLAGHVAWQFLKEDESRELLLWSAVIYASEFNCCCERHVSPKICLPVMLPNGLIFCLIFKYLLFPVSAIKLVFDAIRNLKFKSKSFTKRILTTMLTTLGHTCALSVFAVDKIMF